MKNLIINYRAFITPGCRKIKLFVFIVMIAGLFLMGMVESKGLTFVILAGLDQISAICPDIICFPGIWDVHSSKILLLRSAPDSIAKVHKGVIAELIVRAVRRLLIMLAGFAAIAAFSPNGFSDISVKTVFIILGSSLAMFGTDNLNLFFLRRIDLHIRIRFRNLLPIILTYIIGYISVITIAVSTIVDDRSSAVLPVGLTIIGALLTVISVFILCVSTGRTFNTYIEEA